MPSRFSSLEEKVQRLTLEAIERQWFAGAVIRCEKGGELVYEGAFGHALKTEGLCIPMDTDTVFDIASLTKLFTTTAILRLASVGDLDLDSPISDVAGGKVSEWFHTGEPDLDQKVKEVLEQVTTRMLLTHSSGLHYWYPFYAARNGSGPWMQDYALFATIFGTMLERFHRQNKTIYSDLNFMLAGFVLEAVSRLSLHDAVAQIVCIPLGLTCGYTKGVVKTYRYAATEFGNRIEMRMVEDLGLRFNGWRSVNDPIIGEPNDGNCHYFFANVAGHAGIFATAEDLCKLGNLYAGNCSIDSMDEDLLVEAVQDHGNGRGLGFQVDQRYPLGCGHTGFTGTYLYLSRRHQMVLTVLTNRLHVPTPCDIDPYRKAINEIFLLDMA